jgi:hypothetical protein
VSLLLWFARSIARVQQVRSVEHAAVLAAADRTAVRFSLLFDEMVHVRGWPTEETGAR